jgi:hypothetical protein
VNASRQKKGHKRGMPYSRTLKKWSKTWSDQQLSEIAIRATKVMDAIRIDNPTIANYL